MGLGLGLGLSQATVPVGLFTNSKACPGQVTQVVLLRSRSEYDIPFYTGHVCSTKTSLGESVTP